MAILGLLTPSVRVFHSEWRAALLQGLRQGAQKPVGAGFQLKQFLGLGLVGGQGLRWRVLVLLRFNLAQRCFELLDRGQELVFEEAG